MTKVYIKFLHASDVYAVYPSYDLVPSGEYLPPKVCSRCGENLYLPIEIEDGFGITQLMGEVFRPLPKENPDLVIRGKTEVFLTLRRDSSTFEMVIDDFSEAPVEHVCEDKRGVKC